MAQLLILIQGPPAVGKSTLAARLAHDLALPVVSKDGLKELLHDQVYAGSGTASSEASYRMGLTAVKAMYTIADDILEQGQSCIVESAFHTQYARSDVERLLADRELACIELYCKLDDAVRRQRWQARDESGSRHRVHVVSDKHSTMTAEELERTYAPLGLAEMVPLDMNAFDDGSYDRLLERLRTMSEKQI